MKKQELIERIEGEKFIKNNSDFEVGYNLASNTILGYIKQLDEPQPLKLKDIISRMKQLFPLSRSEWIDEILKEFGEEFGSIKYRSGYEQGKLQGTVEREKVVIPQFVAEHIKHAKEIGRDLQDAMNSSSIHKEVDEWLYTDNNMELFARAWLDGYEIEKEPKYIVKIKSTKCSTISLVFSESTDVWLFSATIYQGLRFKHTRKELEEAGFGWVFDCEGIEIEEVED